MSQTNTRVGDIPVLAGEDLSDKEGRLVKMTHDSGTAVVLPATTQTVYFMMGSVTNSMGTKVVAAANDFVLSLTNAPWLFDGDGVYITTSATNGYTARIVGLMQR